jgi:nuclear pore complex protein Nup160
MADLIFRHKETRLNTVSSIPASTVAIRLPAHGAPTWSSRTTQKRPLPVEVPPAEDETAFKQRYLASAASIYHRQYHTGRSFLWKVLEDGKVFSIQAVDFAGELDASKAASGHLTLRFYLPSPIRPGCVALADSLKHDVLNVFFLTESNHLYTLTLRPEFFRRRSSTEDNVPEWCHTFHPAAFSFRHPHRLIAIDADELLVSTHEGALLRLERAAHGVSPAWKETTHNAGGWKGFKSIIPFQSSNTIRYGKANLDLSAVTSMVVHPMQQEKTKLAFTVSLDHRLRVWNLGSNKLAYVGDLLNQERAPSEMGKYIIHPSQSHLIRVYEMGDEKALVVTYSPAGTGQFKYWEATLQIDGSVELEDAFPDLVLEPPTPTSDVWTLADFAVAIDFGDALNVAHWVLWKNNTVYRVQRVELRLDSPEYTMNQWGAEWTAVATETLLDVPLPAVISTDSADVTEKWVEHILLPGRFSASTIDTALSIYEKGMGVSKTISSAREPRSLAKRMCSLIASHITLEQTADGGMEYEKFRAATDAQWRRFYRLILELDKQRGEALALSFDPIYQMSWVVTADGLTCIRDCSAMEQVWHNQDVLPTSSRQLIARLVSAAAALRDSLRDGVLQTCDSAVAAEVFSDLSGTSMASLENLYDACALSGQISDEDYDRLVNTFGNDMQGLSIEVYEGLLNTMTAAEELHQRLRQVPLAPFGIKAVIKGVHETLELHRSICLDQLVLLLFLACEADEKIELDIVAAYNMLMTMLKRLELLQWLLKNQLNMPLPQSDLPSPSKKDTAEEMKTVTVLEGCIAHLVGLVTHTDESTSSLLTDILVRICNPDGEYELQPALIQCFLLKMERSDLAVEFSRFANQDPFSTYIQGRVFLAARDLTTAATYFQRAAFGLGMYPRPCVTDYTNLTSTSGSEDKRRATQRRPP